jgi:hypothetical protein
VLQLIATELGYENLGELAGFPRHFLLHKVEHDGLAESRHLTLGLLGDLRVLWAEQQFDKLRVKRSILPLWETNLERLYRRGIISGELAK